MKKNVLTLSFVLLLAGMVQAQQTYSGADAARICRGSKSVVINRQSRVPSFITFEDQAPVTPASVFNDLRSALKIGADDSWQQYRSENDQIGFTHTRYHQFYKNVRVREGEYIVHARNGHVASVNGMWIDGLNLSVTPQLTEQQALQKAMQFTGATQFKWQIPAEEAQLQHITNNPLATWLPKGELIIVANKGDIFTKDMKLAWCFDVYASQPVSRQYIYVDAQTGAVLLTEDRIHAADAPGTAATRYSGTQNIVCDAVSANQYRLREAGRGNGVETYNLNGGTNQGNATDFTNTSASWTSNTNGNNVAYDAHWGAEKTYDYYSTVQGRNGIDGAGLLMVSYVHYSNGYDNAFWDGGAMNYGDGSQQPGGFNPLVAIDVCGHEFTHGVTQYTANLDYQDESGALNESFSDCMGTAIEFYAHPSSGNFLIGEQITVTANTALRSMSNPGLYGQPDTYLGNNWYTGTGDNGGVHTNSGVQNYWYYLLCQGGSGTNDNSNSYNITGIGMTSATAITFRSLTYYLINTSQYADARTYSIIAAQDLFGACSPEQIATTNAWYAVGVGPIFSPVVNAAFTADITSSCSVPVTINFTNSSTNATNATWNFGDNTTSTSYSPSHIYNLPGTYTVHLNVNSACGTDSVVQTSYIVINTPTAPTTTGAGTCNSPASLTLTASGSGTLKWYTQATGGTPIFTGTSFTTPSLSTATTYYVENAVAQSPSNVGPVNNSFGTGGQHNNTSTQYLTFDVYQNCTLSTALVNAGAAGNRTFTLWDSQGNLINNYTVNSIPAGSSTITLNIPLTPGSYRIGGTQMNLYRNNSGANYPYNLNGVLSITGSSAGSGFYYYLYNWSVTPSPCTSPRIPVVAAVGQPVVTYINSDYDTVCINTASPFTLTGGSPAGGTYSGPGVTSGVFDPMAAGVGTHTLTYSYTNPYGCSNSTTQTVYVDICNGISTPEAGLLASIFPNPANDQFTIRVRTDAAQTLHLNVTSMTGQLVESQEQLLLSGDNQLRINSAGWSKGVYMISLRTEKGTLNSRIVIQ